MATGMSFILILIVGVLLVIGAVGVVIAMGMGSVTRGNPNRIPCPGCSKMIMTPVPSCPHCGRDLT